MAAVTWNVQTTASYIIKTAGLYTASLSTCRNHTSYLCHAKIRPDDKKCQHIELLYSLTCHICFWSVSIMELCSLVITYIIYTLNSEKKYTYYKYSKEMIPRYPKFIGAKAYQSFACKRSPTLGILGLFSRLSVMLLNA